MESMFTSFDELSKSALSCSHQLGYNGSALRIARNIALDKIVVHCFNLWRRERYDPTIIMAALVNESLRISCVHTCVTRFEQ